MGLALTLAVLPLTLTTARAADVQITAAGAGTFKVAGFTCTIPITLGLVTRNNNGDFVYVGGILGGVNTGVPGVAVCAPQIIPWYESSEYPVLPPAPCQPVAPLGTSVGGTLIKAASIGQVAQTYTIQKTIRNCVNQDVKSVHTLTLGGNSVAFTYKVFINNATLPVVEGFGTLNRIS